MPSCVDSYHLDPLKVLQIYVAHPDWNRCGRMCGPYQTLSILDAYRERLSDFNQLKICSGILHIPVNQ